MNVQRLHENIISCISLVNTVLGWGNKTIW